MGGKTSSRKATMTSATTRRRILDAAERNFADLGFAGTSVRRITSDAQVDLGAVRYHFKTKDALFGEVMRRRLEPLCQERLSRLEDLEKRSLDRPPALEAVIKAFVEPIVELVSDEQHGRHWMKLLGRSRTEPREHLGAVQELYEQLLQRYLATFRRVLPMLPEDEVTYRTYFLLGTQVNTLIDKGTLRALGEVPDVYQDPRGVVARLVRFVAGGMRAPVTRVSRNSPATNQSVAETGR